MGWSRAEHKKLLRKDGEEETWSRADPELAHHFSCWVEEDAAAGGEEPGRTGAEEAMPPLGMQGLHIMSQQSSSFSKEGRGKKSLKKIKINQPQIINKRDES